MGRTLKIEAVEDQAGRARLVRSLLFQDDADARQQLAAERADDGVVMLAFGFLTLVVRFEVGIIHTRDRGGHPQRTAQERRAALARMLRAGGELSGLVGRGINPSVPHQFLQRGEALHVTNFAENRGGTHRANADDAGEMLRQLRHQARERSAEEYAALFRAAGLELTRVIPTPAGPSVVEAMPN